MRYTHCSLWDMVKKTIKFGKFEKAPVGLWKWEEKLKDIEESYYKKFAAMESALAKLQSQQSSLANLFA